MDQCEIRLVGCTLELRFRWLSQCCDVCAIAKDRLVECEELWQWPSCGNCRAFEFTRSYNFHVQRSIDVMHLVKKL